MGARHALQAHGVFQVVKSFAWTRALLVMDFFAKWSAEKSRTRLVAQLEAMLAHCHRTSVAAVAVAAAAQKIQASNLYLNH
mmetsp:Transcript_87243/g.150963  ORF Transcript_87243/g.150963 Transcript_87243/m.150963 type:complete len:81 (-) Transcript_87243:26-268(-)